MRFRLAALLPVAALAAGVGAISTPSATAACASLTKSLSGTVAGTDGRYVNVLIGFDIFNSANQRIGVDGCLKSSGYGATQWLNRGVAPTGSTTNTGGLTKTWRQALPSNAHHVYIENYPKNSSGTTDQRRYGPSLRRNLPVPYATTVNLRLPVICGQGGTTGGIHGYVSKGGNRVQAERVRAWSMSPDSNTFVLGWNIGTAYTNGFYRIPNLAPNQRYVVWATYRGVTQKKYHVPVYPPTSTGACRNTPLNFAF